jgi:VWFA-related protein
MMRSKTRPSPGLRPPPPRFAGRGAYKSPFSPPRGEKVPEGRMRGVLLTQITAILLILIACGSALAQVKESITVSVVEVPVTVVGRDGNPVRGLTAANFEVFDEGKKRSISSFDAIDFMSANIAQAISPLNPAARRNFMLVFDLGYSSPKSIQRAQDAARAFVAKSVQQRDRVAVATLDTERGFSLLTAFTTDRTLIAQAIDDPKAFKSNDPLQVAGSTPIVHRDVALVPRGITGRQGDGPDGISRGDAKQIERADDENAQAENTIRYDAEFNRRKIDRTINTLGALSSVMRSVTGRKQVVLLSEGFDPKLVSGRDSHVTQEATEEAVNGREKGEVWRVDNDKRFGNTASLQLLSSFADACKRADVVLHAIDIKGVRVDNSAEAGLSRESNEGLHLLADATGGTVFKNTNDLGSAFSRMLHEQEVVYVLAINTPANEPGKFHALKVKLLNVPGGAKLSHRSGYFETGAETDAERTLTTAEIIINDIPQSDLRVASVAAPFPGSADKAQVPVIVDINGSDLIAKSEDETIVADIYIYAFDSNGVVRDSLYQRLTLDANKVGEKLRAGGLKYYGTLSLPPATYAVKTLVRLPEQRKNGFARVDLVVPQRNEMAMSRPLFFEDTSRWVLVKGASHDAAGPYPFTIGDSTFIPSASARNRFVIFVANVNDPNVDATPGASLVSKNGNAFVFDVAPNAKSVEVAVRGTALKTAVPLQ